MRIKISNPRLPPYKDSDRKTRIRGRKNPEPKTLAGLSTNLPFQDNIFSHIYAVYSAPYYLMKLSIVSLKGLEFDDEISSLNLKTTSGEITVLNNHRPLITQLSKGRATVIKESGDRLSFDIKSGFLVVEKGNQATILAS